MTNKEINQIKVNFLDVVIGVKEITKLIKILEKTSPVTDDKIIKHIKEEIRDIKTGLIKIENWIR